MVSLTINKEKLFKELGQKESEKIINKIVMMGVEIDEVTEDALLLDITPNRPDLLSQQGFTRALKAFLGISHSLQEYHTTRSRLKVKVDSSCQRIRPYTAAAVVKGLKLDDATLKEIIEIQEKLHGTFCRNRKKAAIGVYPMESINGNITFKALPPEKINFRALESEKEMHAKDILEKHPKGKEFAHLLKGLPMYPVFVDSKNNVLSMPPVINSHRTGKVDIKTKEVFIEASGHDFKTCHEIIKIICSAMADMGGKIQTVDVIYGKKIISTPNMTPSRQQFYRYYVNRRLGTNLKKEQLPDLLGKMGLGFEDGRIKETHYAIIPPYRVDFLHQIDVVEDLAIAYGYENIEAKLPELDTTANESPQTVFADKVRQSLASTCLLEAKNYQLISKKLQKNLNENEEMVTLKSSVSEEFDSMRTSLLISLLQTLQRNRLHEYPQQMFEIGKVFIPNQDLVAEPLRLGVVLAGDVDYTKIRQVVDSLLLQLGLEGKYDSFEDNKYFSGRTAKLSVDGHDVGVVGEVSPRSLELFELNVPVAACELRLDVLMMLVIG